MHTSVRAEQTPNTGHRMRLLTMLPMLDRILGWLTGLIGMTDEEKKDAGIYIGRER
jgi:hypothetical protein